MTTLRATVSGFGLISTVGFGSQVTSTKTGRRTATAIGRTRISVGTGMTTPLGAGHPFTTGAGPGARTNGCGSRVAPGVRRGSIGAGAKARRVGRQWVLGASRIQQARCPARTQAGASSTATTCSTATCAIRACPSSATARAGRIPSQLITTSGTDLKARRVARSSMSSAIRSMLGM